MATSNGAARQRRRFQPPHPLAATGDARGTFWEKIPLRISEPQGRECHRFLAAVLNATISLFSKLFSGFMQVVSLEDRASQGRCPIVLSLQTVTAPQVPYPPNIGMYPIAPRLSDLALQADFAASLPVV
jgi:hypothetical protein